jgi:amino acid adenylation domain-containing protein
MQKNGITEDLKGLFGELTGEDLRHADPSANLFDLGFDSLLLTQASAALKKRFNVKVSFRELLESFTTLDDLARHLGTQIPSERPPATSQAAIPATAELVPSMVAAVSAEGSLPSSSAGKTAAVNRLSSDSGEGSMSGPVIERIMNAQLKIMEQQIALLRTSAPEQFTMPALTADEGKPSVRAPGAEAVSPPIPAPSTVSAPALPHGPFRPLDKGAKGGLTEPQQAHLEWLTRRYVARTAKSKEYTQQHRKYFADPRAVAGFKLQWKELVYPIVSTRSSGAYVWDMDGNRWVDVTLGFGVGLLGHSPQFITEALKRQLDSGVEIGPQSPLAGEVAKLITEFTGMERVSFCNTGSEAVMAAIRLCRTVTGRTRIVFFAGDYHGTFDEVLAKGVWSGDQPKTLPLAPGVSPNLVSEVTVLDYGSERSLEWIRRNAGDLAAVLVEPVQSRNPALQPREFLHELRRITEAAETPLIFDEVITGFRCHPGGAQAYYGVRADLATYGKIIGGGMPIGFIAGRKEYMDALDGGFWSFGDDSFPSSGVTFFAGTFIRHPLAMAAAKAMLLHLKKEGPQLQAGLAERTARLLGELNDHFREHRVPLRLDHFTSVWYPHFGADVKYGSLLYYYLREKGLHIWEGRPCFLSTAHTADDEAFIQQAFKLSVAEMQKGGFLPGPERSAVERCPQATETTGQGGGGAPSTGSHVSPDTGRFPLSEAQCEMWIGSQMGPEAAGPHHACTGLYLDGDLDVELLRRAICAVVQRHAGLRCTFSEDGTEAILHPSLTPEVAVHDLSRLPEPQRGERVNTILHQEGRRLLDLTQGPLVDFQILKLSAQRHMLIFTAQMIVCDGWSHYVVFEDLGAIYSALVDGTEPSAKPAVPMWEFNHWEQANAASDEARECETFWQSQFKTVPAPINLPTLRPRPPARTFKGARRELTLPADLCRDIRRLAKDQKNSYFAVLLAAFQVWLHRLSGARDLVVGVPFAAQAPLGMDRLVGQCANILPLRIQIQSEEAFSGVLRNSWSSVLGAQENWNFTFGRLISRLNLPLDPSRIPLVSIMFNLDPPMAKVKFSKLRHRFITGPRYYFQYDLGFNLVEGEDTIRVECDYNRNLFDGDVVQLWVDGYRALLETVVQKPDQPVGRLPMMNAPEARRLVSIDSGSKAADVSALTVDALFKAQVERAPEAIAAAAESGVLTYRELDQRSSRLGNYLVSLGVGPDTAVGVCVDRSLDLPVVLLAILKAGGAYVLIDPTASSDDAAHVVSDSGVPIILVDDRAHTKFSATAARVVHLGEDASAPAHASDALPIAARAPDRLACIIYKSYGPGRTQGVEITHRGLVNCLLSMQREPGMVPGDGVLCHSPASSGLEIIELWLPLATGARTVISSTVTVLDPAALRRVIEKQNVTAMLATPSAWRMLLDSGWQGNKKLKALCRGEALRPELAERLVDICKDVWNMYGTAETTLVAMAARVQAEAPVTLGRPIDNAQVVLVDEQFEPVPVGVFGEILIAGSGLARGYRNLPALTAEKFINRSIGGQGPVRFFRSGDTARYRPHGGIEFFGRLDRQATVRGCHFEPGDVEAILRGHSAVRDAVVSLRDDVGGAPGVVAYVRLGMREENAISFGTAELIKELRRLVRSRLPEYMLPARFAVIAAIPRTPDGRVDHAALPAPAEADNEFEDYVAPRNKTEEILAGIWQELLKLTKVSVKDSFFDLGGQSLMAVRLFNRIEQEFGRRFPLAMLFRAPTIDQLARKLTADEGTASAWPSLVAIQPQGSKTPLFLAHGAGGNVLLYRALAKRLEPDYPLYGLQSQGIDGQSKPLQTIEEMADRYLQEIRTVQPAGPYLLGGYCLGGTIAYEMAQRLVAGGEKVAMVAMLDTYNFSRALKASFYSFLMQKFRFHWGNFARLRPGIMWRYLREKKRIVGDGGWAHMLTEMPGTTLQDGVARAESGIEASVQEMNDHAADIYDPRPYPGVLTLFKPHINYKFYPDPKLGWGDLALGGLDIVEMPFNPHAMLVEPYVELLARELKARLGRLTDPP